MSEIPQRTETQGSTTFDPEKFFDAWAKEEVTPPYDNDFRKFVIRAFGLRPDDNFVYRAIAEVTLLQAQTYLEFGGQGGLHKWYVDGEGNERPHPPAVDIAAYNDIFRPTTNTANALKALGANAKKETIRMDVANHLQNLYQPPSPERKITVPKNKGHVNPYFDVLAWANQNLEWAGPESTTEKIRISHALLPVLYHHFSCVCPSFESLEIIRLVAKGRPIADVGSGNGYWTYMLRRMKDGKKNLEVVPIDNGLSDWRTLWVPDTVEMDSTEWLKKNGNGKGHVLLLVYPQVSHDFTAKTIKAYHGSTIVIAGSQNGNGYTAFAKELLTDWFAREMPDWEKLCQVPLPSFAGKDEALFVYERKAT